MNTERIKKISGGLLVLLGICSLTFLPGMGFSTGTIIIDSFIPMAYIITGICLFLNRSETFMIRSMAVLEALWVLPSLWLSLRLLQVPAQSIVTGIPGFFSKILWLYYLIHAFRFGMLALLGFYVPYAKKRRPGRHDRIWRAGSVQGVLSPCLCPVSGLCSIVSPPATAGTGTEHATCREPSQRAGRCDRNLWRSGTGSPGRITAYAGAYKRIREHTPEVTHLTRRRTGDCAHARMTRFQKSGEIRPIWLNLFLFGTCVFSALMVH